MIRFAAIAATLLSLQASPDRGSEDTSNLAALIEAAESRRDANVREVRSLREYIVRNTRWKTDATMQVLMITAADRSKRYQILNTDAEGMRRRIFVNILDGEVQAAAKKDRDGNVNARNYELRPILTDTAMGPECRAVQLVPKQKTRFTFEGKGCVDMTDMAIVKMQGRTAKRISLLVGRADVVQEFRKVGDFWYSSSNRSAADVTFLGRTELIINYLSYTITPKVGNVITARWAPEDHAISK